jgi:hypothetical protein
VTATVNSIFFRKYSITHFIIIIKMPTSSPSSRKCNTPAAGDPSSQSLVHPTGSKKKKAASPAMVAAPVPVVAVAPVVGTPAEGNPSSPSKKKKAASSAKVAVPVPVVAVAPVVEPALKKQINLLWWLLLLILLPPLLLWILLLQAIHPLHLREIKLLVLLWLLLLFLLSLLLLLWSLLQRRKQILPMQ